MRKIYLILAAVTGLTFTACTSNDVLVDSNSINPAEDQPIVFSSLNRGFTRADFEGAEAAEKLGNSFVVFGYKGTTTAAPGATVFDNYLVQYEENTANTTASNTNNWEYVGKGTIKHAADNGITSQTIKYWDYSQAQYDFIAWSTGSKTAVYEESELADGKVYVTEIKAEAATSPATGLGAAYTFTGKADDLAECYIADLMTVKKANYNQPVKLRFRALGTKVRIGIYETIPGYSVKDVKFYTAANVALKNDATDNEAKLFTTTANSIFTEGTYTVTFPTVDSTDPDNNQAHIAFAPKAGTPQKTIVDWGGMNYTIAEQGEKTPGEVFLGRTSNTVSYAGDASTNYYEIFLPNEEGTNLNLRVNYTLESIDGSGETILVQGATAQVPSIYTAWKPGFAYTYIFKISDKTNGHTSDGYDPLNPDDITVGSDPAGLYPITFDAVVVNAEDNDQTQETITLVSAPSITTYQKGSTVVNNNEYLASTGDIFVVVSDTDDPALSPDLANAKVQTLTGKAALYTILDGKTEADVIDALQMQDDNVPSGVTIKGRSGLELTKVTLTLTDKIEYGVDGNTITLSTDQVAKFTPAAGTYAFVYTKSAADPANTIEKYQALSWARFDAGQTKYRYDYKAPTTTDAQKGVKYFSKDASDVYTMETPFIGQGVGNLYLDAAGNTIASGYAVTGTTYYYTTDNGMTYTAAHPVAYATDMLTGLYEEDTTPGSFKATTDTELVDGKAYYYKDGTDYVYCVFLPQQTTGWYELDTTKYVEATETAEVAGQTYFDKYVQNDGVYYTKVIKVQ